MIGWLLSLLCWHDWKVVAKTRTDKKDQRFRSLINGKFYGDTWVETIPANVQILLTCSKCGKISKQVLIGEES